MPNPKEILSYLNGQSVAEAPESAIVDLVQTLVGLPLRAPKGCKSYDSDEEYSDVEDKPFQVGKRTRAYSDADEVWKWMLKELASELPRQAGRLTPRDLKCMRREAVERGLLKKLCSFVMWWRKQGCCDQLHKSIMALLISLLGPEEVPQALAEFLKHDAYAIVVAMFRFMAMFHNDEAFAELGVDVEEAPQALFLMCLLLRHDPAALIAKLDDHKDIFALKGVIKNSPSLLTVYLGLEVASLIDKHQRNVEDKPAWAARKQRRHKLYAQPTSGAGDPISKLPAELLQAMFDQLRPVQQVTVLPLVCKRWKEMLTGPAFAWPHVTLEYKKPAAPDGGSKHVDNEPAQDEFEWAWHNLGWDPSACRSADRASAWLKAHCQGLPSISLQPVRRSPRRRYMKKAVWPKTRMLLKALQGPTLTSLHLGSHLAPIQFLQDFGLQEAAASLFPNLCQLRIGDPLMHDPPSFEHQALEHVKPDGLVKLLHSLPQLTSLTVTCDRWDGLQGLEAMTHVTELIISIEQYLPRVPESLQQLTQLQRLALLETGSKEGVCGDYEDEEIYDDFDMRGLIQLTSLTSLQLDGQTYARSCPWIECLKALPLLCHLSMARSWYMGLPRKADDLWQLTKLERLAFGNSKCEYCETAYLNLAKAGSMSNLTHLSLSCGLVNTDGLSKLTTLTLDLTNASGSHDLGDLRALTRLEHLSLSGMQCHYILPADLAGLATLPESIQSVDLSHLGHVYITRSIAGLALQPNLQRVKFRHCQPVVGNVGDDIRTVMNAFMATRRDNTRHPDEDARPSFTSYMHMMSFLYTLALRPLFGLPAVNYEDAVGKCNAFGETGWCGCETSCQQHDAKHTVADLVMKYHAFLLGGYELWDLVAPRNPDIRNIPSIWPRP
ncbi:hypothetical protein WJX74_005003 [Apatococcus lobatus]|uniref:F-box domain-containing protein n=1 Tax=Apatococcus lobatus TaxID=904363 RepID=A0AAW1RDY5_9CHLO